MAQEEPTPLDLVEEHCPRAATEFRIALGLYRGRTDVERMIAYQAVIEALLEDLIQAKAELESSETIRERNHT